jgi:hypothetical protein
MEKNQRQTLLQTRCWLNGVGIRVVWIVVPLDLGCVKQLTIWSYCKLICHVDFNVDLDITTSLLIANTVQRPQCELQLGHVLWRVDFKKIACAS